MSTPWPGGPSGADPRGPAPGSSPLRVLGGRYRLERIVGRGAMGRVWAAHDLVLNRSVAIKEVDFPRGMPASEVDQLAERTMREARAVASVSDPHVVTIFDMLSLPHGPAIVMELLTARSLAEILNVDGPMDEVTAARVGVSVATGLMAAHSAGITHRDVKPGNVLVCDDGRIKLTDFGIARSAGEQTITASGLLLGSPAYISPEVAAGRPANAQSDAWGLGAMLFACVEGVPPFDRGTPMATLTAVVQEAVPPHPRSGRLSGIIRGLLVKDPATRMSVGTALQSMLPVAAESGLLMTHAWHAPARPPTRPPAPGPTGRPIAFPAANPISPHNSSSRHVARPAGIPGGIAPPPWNGPAPALPPPPWADVGAAALRPLPVPGEPRSRQQKTLLALLVVLVAIAAAVAGYFGVRTIAHLDSGVPIAAGHILVRYGPAVS